MRKFSKLLVVFLLMAMTFVSGTGVYNQLSSGEAVTSVGNDGEPVHI